MKIEHGSQILYKQLFDSIGVPLAICEIIYDRDRIADDYRYLKVNPAFVNFAGIPTGMLEGKTSREFADNRQNWLSLFEEVVRTGKNLSLEDYSLPNGSWLELHAFNLGEGKFAFLISDIREQKKLTEALWKSTQSEVQRNHQYNEASATDLVTPNPLDAKSELLMVTLNSLDEAVITTDREGRITLINKAAANLNGYAENEVIGELVTKIFYIFDDQTSQPFVPTVPQENYSNLILATRDLREVPISLNSTFIKDDHEQITGTVIVLRDISEKHKIDQELQKQEKLESLGLLASGIAHDFNNILSAILSNIQLAIIKQRKNLDITKYLLHTVEITRKASDLAKQLLTFSKGGAPVKKNSTLNELIKDTASFVLRGTKTKAEFEIPDDLWAASIDVGQISQVIHNLVLNAHQAMPKGGVISISAENIITGADSNFHPGKYIRITIQDQGIGIPKENLSKIFDPFFTTKTEGNGLGLATSYSIILQHNGYIKVQSRLEAGTTFDIYLPALDQNIIEPEEKREIAALGESLKILLMDDEEEILNSVGEMLEYSGHRVILTQDGFKTIEVYKDAKTRGEPFDVLIMDLTIPGGMGGQEVIAYLRDIDPHVKAIVSSGYANDPILTDYERFGFSGVVSKPYKYDELQEALTRIVTMKQLPLKLDF